MQFKEGNIPLYFQFYLKVKNNILLGEVEPGSRVPNIEKLHERYGVSHATIRKAMGLLEHEGLILKKRGLGTYVRENVNLAAWPPARSLEKFMQAQQTLESKILWKGWVKPPRRIQKLFGQQNEIYNDGQIYLLRRFWTSREEKWRKRVSDAFIPYSLFKVIGEDRMSQTRIVEIAIRSRPYRTIKTTEITRPWICDSEAGELLGMPDGTPIFHRTWIFRAPEDVVLLVTEIITTATTDIREVELQIA